MPKPEAALTLAAIPKPEAALTLAAIPKPEAVLTLAAMLKPEAVQTLAAMLKPEAAQTLATAQTPKAYRTKNPLLAPLGASTIRTVAFMAATTAKVTSCTVVTAMLATHYRPGRFSLLESLQLP